jgi:hypothetical protein
LFDETLAPVQTTTTPPMKTTTTTTVTTPMTPSQQQPLLVCYIKNINAPLLLLLLLLLQGPSSSQSQPPAGFALSNDPTSTPQLLLVAPSLDLKLMAMPRLPFPPSVARALPFNTATAAAAALYDRWLRKARLCTLLLLLLKTVSSVWLLAVLVVVCFGSAAVLVAGTKQGIKI